MLNSISAQIVSFSLPFFSPNGKNKPIIIDRKLSIKHKLLGPGGEKDLVALKGYVNSIKDGGARTILSIDNDLMSYQLNACYHQSHLRGAALFFVRDFVHAALPPQGTDEDTN